LGGRAGGGPSMLLSRPKLSQYQSYLQSNGTTGPATGSLPRTVPCPHTVTPPASTQSAEAGGATTITSRAAAVVNPNIRLRCLDRTAAPSLQLGRAQRPTCGSINPLTSAREHIHPLECRWCVRLQGQPCQPLRRDSGCREGTGLVSHEHPTTAVIVWPTVLGFTRRTGCRHSALYRHRGLDAAGRGDRRPRLACVA
jgi:hypothetical protein